MIVNREEGWIGFEYNDEKHIVLRDFDFLQDENQEVYIACAIMDARETQVEFSIKRDPWAERSGLLFCNRNNAYRQLSRNIVREMAMFL